MVSLGPVGVLRGFGRWPGTVHLDATPGSTRVASLGGMKLQLTALFAMAVYFVYTTTFAALIAEIL